MVSGIRQPAIVVAAWLLALGGTAWPLLRADFVPGAEAAAPEQWPALSEIERDESMPTILMLVHPKCSCSRASIAELAQVMSVLHGRATAHVLFLDPSSENAEWTHSGLWDEAKAIPGVQVHADPDGHDADLFGVKTSGQTLLYDRSGILRFSGGITLFRGHAGDSPGKTKLLNAALSATEPTEKSAVFGCALHETKAYGGSM